MALLDNWDYFKENLDVAYNAEGSLEEQAQIYAESWEAASDRVQAALEGIYQTILDDSFFISLNNGFAEVLSGIEMFVKSVGGIKPIITSIVTLVVGSFADKIPEALRTVQYNIDILFKGTHKTYEKIATDMQKISSNAFKGFTTDTGTEVSIDKDSKTGLEIENANQLLIARNKLAAVSKEMTNSQKQFYEIELSLFEEIQKETVALQSKNDELAQTIELQREELLLSEQQEYLPDLHQITDVDVFKGHKGEQSYQLADQYYDEVIQSLDKFSIELNDEYERINRIIIEGISQGERVDISGQDLFSSDTIDYLSQIESGLEKIARLSNVDASDKFVLYKNVLQGVADTIPRTVQEATKLKDVFDKIGKAKTLKELHKGIEELTDGMVNATISAQDYEKVLKVFRNNKDVNDLSISIKQLNKNTEELTKNKKGIESFAKSFNPKPIIQTSQAYTQLAAAAGNVYSIINSLKSLSNMDNDLSGWEKFSAYLLAFSMLIPQAIGLANNLLTAKQLLVQQNEAYILSLAKEKVLTEQDNAQKIINTTLFSLQTAELNKANKAKNKSIATRYESIAAQKIEQLSQLTGIEQTKLQTIFEEALAASKGKTTKQIQEEIMSRIKELWVQKAQVKETEKETIWQAALNALKKNYIALIAVAVVAIGTALVNAYKKQKEAAEEALEAAIEDTQELIDTQQEVVNSNKELASSYREVYSTFLDVQNQYEQGIVDMEELTKAQKNLRKEALNVANALGTQSAAYAALSGKYELLEDENDKQYQEQLNKLQGYYKNLQNIYVNEAKELETKGYFYITGPGASGFDEEKVVDVLKSMDLDYIKGGGGWTDLGFLVEGEDPRKFVEAYQEVLSVIEQIELKVPEADREESEYYNGLVKWVETYGDIFDKLVEAQEKIETLSLEKAIQNSYSGIKNAYYINSTEDYVKYRDALIADLASTFDVNEGTEQWDELTDAVEGYLSSLENVTEFALSDKALDRLAEKIGGTEEAKKTIREWYNLSGQDELFFTLTFNKHITEEQFEAELSALQEMADRNAIEVKINATKGLKEMIGSDATTDEWMAAIEEFFADYGDIPKINGQQYKKKEEWAAVFLAMTEEEQSSYMRNLENTNQQNYENTTPGTIEALEAAKAELEQNHQDLYNDLYLYKGPGSTNLSSYATYVSDVEKIKAAWEKYKGLNEDEQANYDFGELNNSLEYKSLFAVNSGAELEDMVESGTVEKVEEYQETVQALDEVTAAINEYETQIDSLNLEQAIDDTIGYRDALIEEAEALDIDYDEVLESAKALRKELGLDQKAAEKLALANKKLEKGVKAVGENYEDFDEMMQNVNGDFSKLSRTSPDVINNFNNMKEALGNILGLDASQITDDFLEWAYVSGTLQGIFEGDKEALKALQGESAMRLVTTKVSIEEDPGLYESFASLTDGLQAWADLNPTELQAALNDEKFLSACTEMITAAGMTVEQAQDYFDRLGYDAEIEVVDVPTRSYFNSKIPYLTFDSFGIPTVNYEDVEWEERQLTEVLQVKSINAQDTSSGLNYNNSSNKSSGGGGSSKHAEKKSTGDKERYHTITNQIEDLSAEYDALSEAKDRAFGADRLKNMDAEIAKTDELIDKQKEYIEAIEANLEPDKNIMAAYYDDVIGGPAIEFDEKGNISNFDVIQDAMFDKYNEMADKYTNDDEKWEEFEKKYEQVEKYIEQYEETYDLLRDEEQEYQNLLNQRLDLELEKVQYTVELKLDVSEDQIDLIEYQLGRIEDDSFKSLEAIGLMTAKANELYNQIQINKEGLNEVLGLSLSAQEINQVLAGDLSVLDGATFTEDQINAIKDYRDALLEANEDLADLREEIEERLLDAFDAWQEKIDTGISSLEHYGSIYESYKNIVDIVGKDALGISDSFMASLSQATVDNAIDQLKATKANYEAVEEARKTAEENLLQARATGDESSAQMWEETLETLNTEAEEAQEAMMSSWEEALESVATQFEESVERVVEAFNDAVYAFGGLEGLSDDFSREKEMSDLMLDDYQKIYELSKLNRDVNNSINDIDSISGKQKLKKLLEEINALQEDGVEMSEYDLEYLQKEYDLRLAEIELEEAQNAKNTVRLQKDNEGNWSYVYTQNTDAVDEAQQKYEDALYAMQDLSSNYIDEMSEQLIETSEEMAEALAELRVEDFASLDDYYAEVRRVQEQYQKELDFYQGELQNAIDNNDVLYNTDWKNYSEKTGYKISATEEFATKYKDTLLGVLTGSESDTADFTDNIASSVEALIAGLAEAAEQYYQTIEQVMNAAGTSTDTFEEDAAAAIEETANESAEKTTEIEETIQGMTDDFSALSESISNWQGTYGVAIDSIIEDNLDLINSFNDVVAALAGITNAGFSITSTTTSTSGISQFDTGGYTGSWGTGGKLAILDEKELVLNSQDTANMLTALQLTSDLLDMLDLQTKNAQLGIGSLVAGSIKDTDKEVLEQNVHITAEFPSVTNHSEIEEALLNLNNVASQYANRK